MIKKLLLLLCLLPSLCFSDAGFIGEVGQGSYGDAPSTVTFNPQDKAVGYTLTGSDLISSKTAGNNWGAVRATSAIDSGKYYFEVEVTGTTTVSTMIGVCNDWVQLRTEHLAETNVADRYGASYHADGSRFVSSTDTNAWGATWGAANDVIGVAVDGDTGKIWFSKNNSWQASGDPGAGTDEAATISGTLLPAISTYQADATEYFTVKFSSADWSYSAPSGFSQWPNAASLSTAERMSCTDLSATMETNAAGDGVKSTAGAWRSARAVVGQSTGKRYFEMKFVSGSGYIYAGVANSTPGVDSYFGADANGWTFGTHPTVKNIMHSGITSTGLGGSSSGTVFGYAVDLDADKMWVAYGNTWVDGDPSAGTGETWDDLSGTLYPVTSAYTAHSVEMVFQSADWTYTPPTGFGEW